MKKGPFAFVILILLLAASSSGMILVGFGAFSDSFDRSNQAPVGSPWSAFSEAPEVGVGQLAIVSSQVACDNATWEWSVKAYRTEVYSANHWSEVKVTSAISSAEVGGPAVRVQAAGLSGIGYVFTVYDNTSAGIWVVYEEDGEWVQIGADFSGTFAQNDGYRLSVSGNVLTVLQNGSLLGTRTDASNYISSGGAPGIFLFYPATMDDWAGGNN